MQIEEGGRGVRTGEKNYKKLLLVALFTTKLLERLGK